MSGKFLKKAREIHGDFSQTPSEREERAKRFSVECWSEILAVVEATEATTDGRYPCAIGALEDALDALDKKAGEL